MKDQSSSLNFSMLLGLIFIILKLTKHIDWSWWYVLMPFYILPLIYLAVLFVISIFKG
jgi:hypothetical protein